MHPGRRRKLAIDAPISMKFDLSLWPRFQGIVSLEARSAAEEAWLNSGFDQDDQIESLVVNLALSRRTFFGEGVCYSSVHAPLSEQSDDFILTFNFDAKSAVEGFFARGGTDENGLIIAITSAILPEFKRLCNLRFIQLAAQQSNTISSSNGGIGSRLDLLEANL